MTFVAIDFETANRQRNSACALGLALVDHGRVASTKSWLICPPIPQFDPINISIHGITERDVAAALTFDELWPEVLRILDGKIIIAHNASFDVSVLRSALDVYGIPFPALDYCCTLQLSRRVWPRLANYKLPTVAEHLGITFRHHDASADAAACAEIALACLRDKSASSLGELARSLDVPIKPMTTPRKPREAQARKTQQAAESTPVGNAFFDSRPAETAPTTQAPEARRVQQGDGLATSHFEAGKATVVCTKSGQIRYTIEVRHDGLNRYQVLRDCPVRS